MLITQKISHITLSEPGKRMIDTLPLEWYEVNKRILHKRTLLGKEVVLRFLQDNPHLRQGDVLYEDNFMLIVVEILPCETIMIKPETHYDLAFLCYELGSKHLSLFYENGELLIPYDIKTYNLLQESGFQPICGIRQLTNQLKATNVYHHKSEDGFLHTIRKLASISD
jgi:urease accessory protein